jgi:hypothetical protein
MEADMKRLFTLVVLTTSVLCPLKTATGGGPVHIDEVRTEPNTPTNRDPITIVVSGDSASKPVWIDDSNFMVEGASLELDIFITVGPLGMGTWWSHSETIGTLPVGSYDLTVRAYSYSELTKEYVLTDTYLMSFTVVSVNSNSIVEDGIEYYVQTDKAVYVLGEDVEMLYRVTNLRDEEVTFSVLPSPPWNFWVRVDGNDIFRAVNGWWGVPTEFTLGPDECKEFPDSTLPYAWDMRDKNGNIVNAGEYLVIGGLYSGSGLYDYTKVGVPIKIISELVEAVVDVVPDTVNLRSKGKWLSCKIWLPEDYNVADVNSETVFIEDEIPAEWIWFNEEQNVVMAKFARSQLQEILEPGEVELTVTGFLADGTYFEGKDTIRVIDKGRKVQLRRKRRHK